MSIEEENQFGCEKTTAEIPPSLTVSPAITDGAAIYGAWVAGPMDDGFTKIGGVQVLREKAEANVKKMI